METFKNGFFRKYSSYGCKSSLKRICKKTLDKIYAQYARDRERKAERYEYQNRPLMVKICRFLACKKDTPALAVAMYCDISVQKAVGLLRKMAQDDELITISRHWKSRNTYNLAKGITFYK